jgi:hypothetical protein
VQRILLKDTVTHAVSWEYSQGETEYIPQQDTNKTLTCDDVTLLVLLRILHPTEKPF